MRVQQRLMWFFVIALLLSCGLSMRAWSANTDYLYESDRKVRRGSVDDRQNYDEYRQHRAQRQHNSRQRGAQLPRYWENNDGECFRIEHNDNNYHYIPVRHRHCR